MQAMWQQPRHVESVRAGKIQGKEGWEMGVQKAKLPLPLTEENVKVCLSELNTGTRRAVETCIECFQNNRMSKEDLLCFMQSIASQGKTLKALFSKPQQPKTLGEAASDADLAAIRALGGKKPVRVASASAAADPALAATSAQFGDVVTEEEMTELRALAAFSAPVPQLPPKQHETVCTTVHGSDVPLSSVATRPNAIPAAAPKPKPARVRRAKITEPTDEEKALMAWWSERRIPEVFRRQTESCDQAGRTSDNQKRIAYMRHVFSELRNALPAAGKKQLLSLMSSVNSSGSDEEFASGVKDLVDTYDVKISLNFAPECTVRRLAKSRLNKGELGAEDEDDWSMEAELTPTPVKAETKKEAEETKEPAKRKRTETLKGAEPKVDGEEDEDARCPVCIGCPQDDDRWVKCDGCSSWYHQICVLFNEQAHGKSVRFFCRTPGCRKRGSRQLNRRQRKPCYPSSPGLEDSNLGSRLSRFAQQFARPDRRIVVKMVANQMHVREVRRGRSVVEETVHSKTLLCFQHTMIGSDLLFLVMFVDEIRCSDGTARVEITHIDSNGLYEGMEEGERQRAEGSVVVGYLEHAADCGFATARVSLRDTSADSESLFYTRPHGKAWGSLEEAHRFMTETLTEARTGGLVHSFGTDAERPGEMTLGVRLNTDKREVDASDVDPEMRSVVAGRPSEWAELMSGNNYRFDSLQFAKFSSMMLVYHVIKGSKRDTARGMPSATPINLAASQVPDLSDDEEDIEFDLQARKRARTETLPVKREEPPVAHVPQPPAPQPCTAMFESPCVRASSALMPSPMVRYSLFSGPSESPAIRSSAFPGPLESPAIRASVFRGPGESPAIGASAFRGPGESPAIGASMWRGPGDSPAIGASLWRGPGESPAIGASAWRGPGESPATRPICFPGESPATRPICFPGESPAMRSSAFPLQSPGVRAVNAIMASPGMVNLPRRSPPRVPSLGASQGEDKGGQMEPIFSFSDSMLEDVVDQSLGSAFSENHQGGGAAQDPFWDNFLTQLQQ